MFEGVFLVWFFFVVLSLGYTAYSVSLDPISWVQKLGWILVVGYSGPFGLFFYIITCRNPGKGLHEIYTKAPWKQSVNSEVHCLAGDATGIIIAAIIMSFMTISNGIELIIEYLSAFVSGWVIFQAGMMRNMFGSYGEALKKTFFAETVSMNMVMLGMIPSMMFLMHHIPHAHHPGHAAFWFSMGISTIMGGFTAFPINAWLIHKKLKHGCMTLGQKGSMVQVQAHQMGSISLSLMLIMILLSFIMVVLASWISSFYIPLTF